VTGHDGRAPFHLIGVTPDIALQPTLAGLRAGRDELLDRALQVLGGRQGRREADGATGRRQALSPSIVTPITGL
jgi:hypothetical protein